MTQWKVTGSVGPGSILAQVTEWLHGSSCFLRLGHTVTKSPMGGPGGNGIWVEPVPSLSGGETQLNPREPHPLGRQTGYSLFRGQEGHSSEGSPTV